MSVVMFIDIHVCFYCYSCWLGKRVTPTITKETKMKHMIQKLDYNIEEISDVQLDKLVQDMVTCFKSTRNINGDSQALVKQMTTLSSNTLRQLMDNCEGRQPYIDTYMRTQARLMYPEIEQLETSVDSIKGMVLNFFNAFTKNYVTMFNQDRGAEMVVSHKAFKTKLQEVVDGNVQNEAKILAEKMFAEMVAKKAQNDSDMKD